jgi:hypothetical protein
MSLVPLHIGKQESKAYSTIWDSIRAKIPVIRKRRGIEDRSNIVPDIVEQSLDLDAIYASA